MGSKNSIIVKKIKKGGHGGHHGGAWKVAYADFVTAMMAFFLLLWLLSMNSDEKRARISAYFKHFSIFTSGGTSFMEKSSSMFKESGPTEQKVFAANNRSEVLANIQKVEDAFQKKITESLSEGEGQVAVKISNDKIRIQMIDQGREMFERGSSILTPTAREILKAISENIGSLPNEVSVEGHTDSIPLDKDNYTNWELSADRAAAARRALEANGINPERITRISGYADKEPYDKNDPNGTKNRRITVVLDPYVKIKKPIRDEETGKIVAWKGVDNLTLQKLEEILFKTKVELKHKSKLPPQSKAAAQEKANWGPIIKKEDWTPVMKDESVNPVISSDNWEPVVPGYKWKPVENEEQPASDKSKNTYTEEIIEEALAAENPSNSEMNGYFDSAIKGKIRVSSPSGTSESEIGSNKKVPAAAESAPALKDKAWGPVIKEDEWNPVIKNDDLNVLK